VVVAIHRLRQQLKRIIDQQLFFCEPFLIIGLIDPKRSRHHPEIIGSDLEGHGPIEGEMLLTATSACSKQRAFLLARLQHDRRRQTVHVSQSLKASAMVSIACHSTFS
jgi:hypothetical protein